MAVSHQTMLLLIKFRICGNLRYLSHAETLKLLQRACVRAAERAGDERNWSIAYSGGFNPHPKLSLPLPRPVGVESDDELLCLGIQSRRQSGSGRESFDTEAFRAGLSGQLPDGCELLSVGIAERKTSVQPSRATYVLTVRGQYLNENLKTMIERLLASESLSLKRQMDAKGLRFKDVDVRGFLESIELDDTNKNQMRITIVCKIGPAGTIRVDEILKLLEVEQDMLASPVRRTNVEWQIGGSQRLESESPADFGAVGRGFFGE